MAKRMKWNSFSYFIFICLLQTLFKLNPCHIVRCQIIFCCIFIGNESPEFEATCCCYSVLVLTSILYIAFTSMICKSFCSLLFVKDKLAQQIHAHNYSCGNSNDMNEEHWKQANEQEHLLNITEQNSVTTTTTTTKYV